MLYTDAAVGAVLCLVWLGRVLFGAELGGLTWNVVAVATLACTSLIVRHRWPLLALGLAVACGVMAMPVRLDDSAVDLVVGGGLLVATLLRLVRLSALRRTSPWAGALRGSLGPVWWRTPLLAAVAVAGVLIAPVDMKESAAVAVLLAAHVMGRTTSRGLVIVAGVLSAVTLAVGGTLVSSDAWTGPHTPVPLIAVALVGAAVGDAVRSRREAVIASQERARRMEQALDEEARRRVAEERLRIAREVHDLVAHHIAVVNMQAGVASHLLVDKPEEAAEALGHVRAASRSVLNELGSLLSVLRDPDEPTGPAEPTPRMADLDRLIDSFTAAGLQVEPIVSGPPQELPPTTDLAAYRVIQECLTNAHKHGEGSASLHVTYATGWLGLDVRNSCAAIRETRVEPGTGHGVVGMRERLVAVGGSLTAGPTDQGDFVVSARLPLAHAPVAVHAEGMSDEHPGSAGRRPASYSRRSRVLIDSDPDMEVVGEASTGTEAVTLARETRADVVLMDIRMPELDGLAATIAITADEDLAGVRVLILTTFEIDDYVFRALRAGASGFIGKGVGPEELLDAIRVVARGDALLSPQATKGLIARFLAQPANIDAAVPAALEVLTEREREVVALVAAGLSNDEIAERLHLSPLTVKTHVTRSMTKLGARDRAQLVVVAFQTGLVRTSLH